MILLLIVLHFSAGFLTLLPSNHFIRTLPIVQPVVNTYIRSFFLQGWGMFAPPPHSQDLLEYAALIHGSWSAPIVAQEKFTRGIKDFFLPRGAYRLSIFFENSFSENADSDSDLAIYYQ